MKYNEKELELVTEPQVFDPPRWMLVSDFNDDNHAPYERKVCAIVKNSKGTIYAITEDVDGSDWSRWAYCAEIPEESKPRLATYRELSHWLAQGNGEMRFTTSSCTGSLCYAIANESELVPTDYEVRKRDDTEWHTPTREYLGLEGK